GRSWQPGLGQPAAAADADHHCAECGRGAGQGLRRRRLLARDQPDPARQAGIDAYIAVDKDQHNRQAASPRGRIPKSAGPRERMRRKTRTKKGRAFYKRRKHVAEPPFGFIKQGLGFRQFLLRGLEKVSGEWKLGTLAYKLR